MWLDNSAECREEVCVNVISWNLAGRLRRIPQQVERLATGGAARGETARAAAVADIAC
jgi:hypothetical protein